MISGVSGGLANIKVMTARAGAVSLDEHRGRDVPQACVTLRAESSIHPLRRASRYLPSMRLGKCPFLWLGNPLFFDKSQHDVRCLRFRNL